MANGSVPEARAEQLRQRLERSGAALLSQADGVSR